MAIPDKLPDSVRIGGSALVQRVRHLLIHMFQRFMRNNYYFGRGYFLQSMRIMMWIKIQHKTSL